MKREAIFDYFLVNGAVHPAGDTAIFDPIPEDAIYEVVKLVDGVPLFFDAHMDRMVRSADLLGVHIDMGREAILDQVAVLSERNQCRRGNVKLVWSHGGEGPRGMVIYFIPSEDPGPMAGETGIHAVLFHGERKTPHLKTLGGSFRDRVKRARDREGAFEALLVDEAGRITEGSRSNIFYLLGGDLLTPPAKSVLPGVTRSQVFEICRGLAIPISERPLHLDDLPAVEGAFLTGTTVDVVPIGSVGSRTLPSADHTSIQRIIKQYGKAVREDIRRRASDVRYRSANESS